jgi:hypothetical protein
MPEIMLDTYEVRVAYTNGDHSHTMIENLTKRQAKALTQSIVGDVRAAHDSGTDPGPLVYQGAQDLPVMIWPARIHTVQVHRSKEWVTEEEYAAHQAREAAAATANEA